MVKFTTERVKIIEFYFENGWSIVATQKSYMHHFNVRHRPSRPEIMSLVMHFQEQGSVNEFIHKLIMGDEAHFHLNGYVNKQNTRFWGTENACQVHASPMHQVNTRMATVSKSTPSKL